MALPAFEDIQQNSHALAVAQAVALADDAVADHGGNTAQYFVRVHEEGMDTKRAWRVYYIPRTHLQQRGGGFEVAVEEQTGRVTQFLRCQ